MTLTDEQFEKDLSEVEELEKKATRPEEWSFQIVQGDQIYRTMPGSKQVVNTGASWLVSHGHRGAFSLKDDLAFLKSVRNLLPHLLERYREQRRLIDEIVGRPVLKTEWQELKAQLAQKGETIRKMRVAITDIANISGGPRGEDFCGNRYGHEMTMSHMLDKISKISIQCLQSLQSSKGEEGKGE